jgi:RNA polymerase sigma-70 factor (ECF subfamily)
MEQENSNPRLSRISTLWTLVDQAHTGPEDAVSAAQRVLLERYAGAVHRYLLGALRDVDAADELFQEFSLRFLRGGFRNACPERGRFRDYVKTALFHLILDYKKRQGKRPASLTADVPEPSSAAAPGLEGEEEFLKHWRQELMERTWLALADVERQTGQPCYTVLHFRTSHPLLSSAELAEQVGALLHKSFTVDGVRQALHRARAKFTQLLLDQVVHSMEKPSPEDLEQELEELGLLSYCRPALEQRGRR